MLKILSLVLLLSASGCTFHYQNEKGIKLTAKDIKTDRGTIEKVKPHFWSKLDIWIPRKPKD